LRSNVRAVGRQFEPTLPPGRGRRVNLRRALERMTRGAMHHTGMTNPAFPARKRERDLGGGPFVAHAISSHRSCRRWWEFQLVAGAGWLFPWSVPETLIAQREGRHSFFFEGRHVRRFSLLSRLVDWGVSREHVPKLVRFPHEIDDAGAFCFHVLSPLTPFPVNLPASIRQES